MMLPEQFSERTRLLPDLEFEYLAAALATVPPVSIRHNNAKPAQVFEGSKVPWCENGSYLTERPSFTADPAWHAGAYYVQEASSMFLCELVKQFFPNAGKVLDLCAAPGGKSTLLCQSLPANSLLVSNEIIRSRAEILAENIIKWGKPGVVVSCNKPKDFAKLSHFFDAIVVDAPCSGEGMFRKDPGAIREWSVQNVNLCAKRQKEILTNIADSLIPGGILVYSTCTFNREENEEIVEWAAEHLNFQVLSPDTSAYPEIVNNGTGCRFYPHKVKGEGFFVAVLRKNNETPAGSNLKKNQMGIKGLKLKNGYNQWLKNCEDWTILESKEQVTAYPTAFLDEHLFLQHTLYCLVNGLVLFQIKGSDLIPSHQLALSQALDVTQCKHAELDYPTAVSYLKRENIYLPESDKGYVLVKFQQYALGWVKNLGNRSNNLYPKHWKIRMNL